MWIFVSVMLLFLSLVGFEINIEVNKRISNIIIIENFILCYLLVCCYWIFFVFCRWFYGI